MHTKIAIQLKSHALTLLKKNFDATLAYERARRWRDGRNRRNKLLVYQMGKVGSTSILKALQVKFKNEPVYHIHFLAQDLLAQKLQAERKSFYKNHHISRHFLDADYIRRQLDSRQEQVQHWKIITLLRDPIAQRVSRFFQVTTLPESLSEQPDNSRYINNLVQTLVDCFLDSWLSDASEPYSFFNSELKANFGFDIFAHSFDRQRGYQIYTPANGPKILCFQLEQLSNCSAEAFYEFMGLKNFTLGQANVGSKKGYAVLYKQFKAALRLPHDFAETVYNSAQMAHFYSPEAIARFRQRWQTIE